LINYIIDTNVLLTDPEAIYKFEENAVVIPIGVIEELDNFKKNTGELGRNARQVSRQLDKAREEGDLRKGVPINDKGGIVRVLYNGNLGSYRKEANVDFHVIHIAEKLSKEDPSTECVVVSRDTNVRIRANALGIKSDTYQACSLKEIPIDCGFSDISIESGLFKKLSSEGKIPLSLVFEDEENEPHPNHYLLVFDKEDEDKKVLAKVKAEEVLVEGFEEPQIAMFISKIGKINKAIKIAPQNKEQTYAMDALLDPNIHLVCLVGKAGTGKTLLATAVGNYLVERTKTHEKMLISRPIQPMGKDIGFLPGDVNEKLDPWMQPIYDALEIIHGKKTKSSENSQSIDGKKIAKESNKIFVEPLTYIRGRSIHNQFLIIDESQNLTALEVKTIITRAGENTKIILTGDIDQIDNPYLDDKSNGLAVTINAFKDSEIAAHIHLSKGVRSRLSEEATKRL
jgi:PhoH-like ATPase